MKKLKILNISFDDLHSPGGGLGVFTRDHGNAMGKIADVTTVTMDPKMEKWHFGPFGNQRLLTCVNTNYQMKVEGPFHLLQQTNMMMQNIMEFIGREEFDVIHNHDTSCWNIAQMCQALYKAPIISTCHLSFGLVHHEGHVLSEDQFRWELTQEANCYHASEALTTMSEAYAQKLSDKFLLDRDFDLIPNGVDLEPLSKVEPDLDFKKRIAGDKPLVGFVGRMVPSKGILDILAAAEVFPDHHFLIKSYVAPSVEKVYKLIEEVRERVNSLENVTWISDMPSHDPKKWEIMKACDLALIPSKHEPFGIVALEWGALQVPKIVSKVDGLVDHNSENDADMIEPNAEELIAAIKAHKRDERKVKNAYSVAEAHRWDSVANKMMEVYERCLSTHGK